MDRKIFLIGHKFSCDYVRKFRLDRPLNDQDTKDCREEDFRDLLAKINTPDLDKSSVRIMLVPPLRNMQRAERITKENGLQTIRIDHGYSWLKGEDVP